MSRLARFLITAAATLLVLAGTAHASTTVDLRGQWNEVDSAGGVDYNATATITSEDLGTGAFSGNGSGNGYTWPMSGTITDHSLSYQDGPYDQLPSYTSQVTATVSADGNDISGTFHDSNGQTGTVHLTRVSGPPQQPPPPPPQIPQLPPNCTTATTLLVTCSSTAGGPGVCGPTGPILPACYLPVNLPTVCGGSGSILAPCQSKGPYIVACGGLGTILPPCHLPPPQLPQVCGGTGSILPACTGANNPILVCGPSGTVLPQCAFPAKIKAAVINLPQDTGEIDVDTGCSAAVAAAAGGSRATAAGASTCKLCTRVQWQLQDLHQAVISEIQGVSAQYRADIFANASQVMVGDQTVQIDPPMTDAQAKAFSTTNQNGFVSRARGILDSLVLVADQPPAPTVEAIAGRLASRVGTPNYVGPLAISTSPFVRDAPQKAADSILRGYAEYWRLKNAGAKGSAARSAKKLNLKLKTAVTRTYRLKRGRHRLRIKLPRTVVRNLARVAGRGNVVPLRVVLAFDTKPRPVVRFVDVRLRVRRR